MATSNEPRPTLLARRHPHPRDAMITFIDEGHKYIVDWDGNGQPRHDPLSLSVTSTTKAFWKTFDAERIISGMKPIKPTSKYAGLTDQEIKAQWAASGLEARTTGTAMHDMIERYYNDMLPPHKRPALLRKEYEHFIAWAATIPYLEPYRSEWFVHTARDPLLGKRKRESTADEKSHEHPETLTPGAIDMMWVNLLLMNDPVWVAANPDTLAMEMGDWKRLGKGISKFNPWDRCGFGPMAPFSNCNFYNYSAQLNLYCHIIENYYHDTPWNGRTYKHIKVVNMFLVVIHARSRKARVYECENMRREIKQIMAMRAESLARQRRSEPGLYPFDMTQMPPPAVYEPEDSFCVFEDFDTLLAAPHVPEATTPLPSGMMPVLVTRPTEPAGPTTLLPRQEHPPRGDVPTSLPGFAGPPVPCSLPKRETPFAANAR
jgi:hypothetical protein